MVEASPMWGLIAVAIAAVGSLIGIPIAAAVGIPAFILAWLFFGTDQALVLIGINAWEQASRYSLSLIPLFILMGEFVHQSGLGAECFDCFHMWLNRVKGSLAIVTTVSCAVFGCVTGSTAGTMAAIGGIAMPEMKKHGYAPELRTGCLANVGALANLIPPSLIAVYYCVLTENSIGQVFMAGLIPGVILTLLWSITVYLWVWFKPSIAPMREESFSLKQKVVSLKAPTPIFIIFFLIVGGIYTGIFSANEAAGIGAAYSLILVLILRRLTWQGFKDALRNSLRFTLMILMIVMGAMVLSHSIAVSQLPAALTNWVMQFDYPKEIVMFIIIGLFIVLGMFMDVWVLIMLFVPLFYPVVVQLGFDPVWYGTMSVVLVELAMVTPPIATHIWIASLIDGEAGVWVTIKGVIPFYSGIVLLLVLLVIFPQIALWLPSTMLR